MPRARSGEGTESSLGTIPPTPPGGQLPGSAPNPVLLGFYGASLHSQIDEVIGLWRLIQPGDGGPVPFLEVRVGLKVEPSDQWLVVLAARPALGQ